MRHSLVLLLCLAAAPLRADFTFAPPAPTTRSFVIAEARETWTDGCVPRNAFVSRAGQKIDVLWNAGQGGAPCAQAFTQWSDDVPLGTLAAGTYTVTFRAKTDAGAIVNLGTETLLVREATPSLRFHRSIVPGNQSTQVDIFDAVDPRGFCHASATVKVDGVKVTSHVSTWGYEPNPLCFIRATLPPHAPGAVDVHVDGRTIQGEKSYTVVGGISYVDPSSAPDPALHERVLVPVLFEGDGDHGSRWTTDATMVYPIGAPGIFVNHDVMAPLPPHGGYLAPRSLLELYGNHPTGLVVFVPRGQEVRFGTLVRDVSRAAAQWGSEVPVVREGDLRREVELVNVPLDPRYRLQLRIYGTDGVGFPVTITADTPNVASARGAVLSGPCSAAQLPCNSRTPAYVSVDPRQMFAHLSYAGRMNLRITSSSNARKLWAFITATNNETQNVTVITPQ